MKRIIESLLIIVLVTTVTVGTTAAYFTDSATAADNKIVTGEMELMLNNNTEPEMGPALYGVNMYPGTYVQSSALIKNNGEIAFNPSIKVASAVDPNGLGKYLWLQIWTEGKLWFSDWIKQAPGYTTDKVTLDTLNPSEEVSVSFRIIMHEDTPDSYQNTSYKVDTVVTAYQVNDPAGAVTSYTAGSEYESSSFSYSICGLRPDSPYYTYDQDIWRIQTLPKTTANSYTALDGSGEVYCQVLH